MGVDAFDSDKDGKLIQEFIRKHCNLTHKFSTDEKNIYNFLGDELYQHSKVNHGDGIYYEIQKGEEVHIFLTDIN